MSKEKIIITNEEKIAAVKKKIIIDGPEKLHLVSDFDKTLTSYFVKGKKIVSLISILRDEHYLTPGYSAKAQALYDKYHAVEINPNISFEEKKKMMREWWTAHYELLIKSGLNRKDIEKAARSDKIALRPGAAEFFDFLHEHNIPLLILSAAGLGVDAISLYLSGFNKLYENIFIASNTFDWGEDGKLIGVKEPLIHTFNKDYASVRNFPFFKKIENRKNVILLGDDVGDAAMVNGFNYDNIIKIGFLNENLAGNLANFNNYFDVIILSDGPMDYVNILLRELVNNGKNI